MVPVSLRLENFMSYGTGVPALNFEEFEIACLSGGNGQGKSALLDAITWVLWGKARKARGNRSAAHDLIRAGTDAMKVEFVFDVAGVRHRVIRSFSHSKGQGNLELHTQVNPGGRYELRSAANLKETAKKIIDEVVGLDYDTFINSALQPQGRSDQFASSAPGERKKVLSRILNLGRYDRLRDLATTRVKEARDNVLQHEADIARLEEELKKEAGLQEEKTSLDHRISEQEKSIEDLRTEEHSLVEKVSRLQTLQQQLKDLQDEQSGTEDQLNELSAELESIEKGITEAKELLSRSEEIKGSYRQWLELDQERQKLDEQLQFHRSLEGKVHRVESALADRRRKEELKLKALENDVAKTQGELKKVQEAEVEEERIQGKLQEIHQAIARREAMEEARQTLEGLQEQADHARTAILQEHSILKSKVREAYQRQKKLTNQRQQLSRIPDEYRRLTDIIQKEASCSQARDAIQEKGKKISLEIDAIKGLRQERAGQHKQVQEQLQYLSIEDAGACPTCGTDLTFQHRCQVQAKLQEELDGLEADLERDEKLQNALEQQRQKLLERWKEKTDEMKAIQAAQKQLVPVASRFSEYEKAGKELSEVDASLCTLEQKIQGQDFAHESRKALQKLAEQIERLDFDSEEFKKVSDKAAQLKPYSDRMGKIEAIKKQKPLLLGDLARHQGAEQKLRQQFDDGTLFGEFQEKLKGLKEQITEVGYDGERLGAVKFKLGKLKDAPVEMGRLGSVEKELASLRTRRTRTAGRIDAENNKYRQRKEQIEEIQADTTQLQTVERDLGQTREALTHAGEKLKSLEREAGKVEEQLQRIQEQRAQLKASKKACERFRTEKRHYEHLVTAFGKNGIPAAIIERMLPTINQMAGDLLHQLSDGQMALRIDAQRITQKGDMIDTLDIKVKGDQGTYRAYETFSGGEAFRINFALRIALSQLLTDRSGVQVRMLVIDEGFGTQDETGVEHLLKAIETVRSEFDKILVISHIDEVKDAFPARIEVTKDPATGSTFELMRA